jgi:hypothetical protein
LAEKSARLKLGWGMKNLHGIKAELKESRKGSMATGLMVEDRLDGATSFGSWKERMIFLLQENELWDTMENTTTHPVVVPTDATLLVAYTKKSIKAKRFILDAIKDHLIPHLTGKTHAYYMWESLTKLY